MRHRLNFPCVLGLIVLIAGSAGCAESKKTSGPDGKDLYLDLMKLTLTDLAYEPNEEVRAKRKIGKDCRAALIR